MSAECNLFGEDGLPRKIQTESCPTPLNSLANILFTSTFRKTGVYILKARDAQIVKKIQFFFNVLGLFNSFDCHC